MGAGWKHGPARGKGAAPKGGEGWGGGANGEGREPFKPAGDPASDEIRKTMNARGREVRARKEEALDELYGVLHAIALEGEVETNRMHAASKLCDRIEGTSVQRQDVTSKGERMGYVIPAPPEAEDATTWAEQYKPR